MQAPTKWPAFRKRYLKQDRHDDYASAQREVSAGWAVAKQLRDSGTPNWRVVADQRMKAIIADNVGARDAERDRVAAAAQAERDRVAAAAQLDRDNQELLGKTDGATNAADAMWTGGWSIGGRVPNKANIWIQLDAQKMVSDRRVVKDTGVEPGQWIDLTRWSGPDLRDLQNRTHMDYVIQNRLSSVPDGGEGFVRANGYRNILDQYVYRTIQEYCDAGDLSQVGDRHPNGTPEPLMWRMLEQLAKAATVMEQGSLDGPVPGWQQIIHYDFKLDNVFLTASNVPNAIYPNAKLGDFELSLQTSQEDPFNPKILRAISAHALSWAAPETRTDDSRYMCMKVSGRNVGYLDGVKILAPVNVWGIGICAYELMNGNIDYRFYEDAGTGGTGFTFVDSSEICMKNGDPFFENWEDSATATYSSHLIDIVKRCLEDKPADRITPTALLAMITDPVPDAEDNEDETVDDRNLAQMGKGDSDGVDVDEAWPAFVPYQSMYRLGMTMQDIANGMEQALGGNDDGDDDGDDGDGGDGDAAAE